MCERHGKELLGKRDDAGVVFDVVVVVVIKRIVVLGSVSERKNMQNTSTDSARMVRMFPPI